jgi:hypothetical protein
MSLKMNLGSDRCCVNNIVKGIIGQDGKIGLAGPIGIMGYTGSTGAFGPQGATGLCYRGYKGAQGAVGAQGGLTGNTGPIGPVGSTGPGVTQNLNFSFTTSTPTSYSTVYTDLTTLASGSVSNTITLGPGTYAANFEINEDWIDTGNKFYVSFNNGPSINSIVFTQTTPLVLTTNTNTNKMYGTGNDVVTFSSSSTYTINLFQSTTSGSINISGKKVNFSVTFIKIQ